MMELDLSNYEMLLAEAGRFHGDICPGIQIGTRKTMCGLKRIGLKDPPGADRKKLMVFVEIDRCATDAIMALTGCRPGKRTMKIRDYGKMAATFINLDSGKAVRVAIKLEKEEGKRENPDFGGIPEEDLFSILDVEVPLRPEDMPGKPLRRCQCARCGAIVLDGRDIIVEGEAICRPCFEQANYYRLADPACAGATN
jgi:formylmethanofuran dehydrogenase subunit E